MGIGSALKVPGFGVVSKSVLKPRGWMKPDVLDDNPEPHRFAQFLGFLFMTAGSIALFLGAFVGLESGVAGRHAGRVERFGIIRVGSRCITGWVASSCPASPKSRPPARSQA